MEQRFKIESVELIPFHLQRVSESSQRLLKEGPERLLFVLPQFPENTNFQQHRLQLLVSFDNLNRGEDQGFPYWQIASAALSVFLLKSWGNSTLKFLRQKTRITSLKTQLI